jgi:mannose-6-phosphate isomerase
MAEIASMDGDRSFQQILEMRNPIQTYAWGSRTAIAKLMRSTEMSDQPQAEIWMGAHPKAPSRVRFENSWQRLDTLIERHPVALLGPAAVERFGHRLPFLLKVLAVAQPLSIQAHPNAAQAESGYSNENNLNIPIDADHRNYKDDRHKPECICALSPFYGLCGFRPADSMAGLLTSVWPDDHATDLKLLFDQGLEMFFAHIMGLEPDRRSDLVSAVVQKVMRLEPDDATFEWVLRLHQRYPGDIGVLAPLLLNLVRLDPGQALFLAAGQLHAYLEGVGVELMANSDNVLRGGLTPKHIDVPELLKILDFTPFQLNILQPRPIGEGEKRYPSLTEDFSLSTIEVNPSGVHVGANRFAGPEILLCTQTLSGIECQSSSDSLTLQQGRSVFIPAGVAGYSLKGSGTVFRAMMNHPLS